MKKVISVAMLIVFCNFISEMKGAVQLYSGYSNDLWQINHLNPDGQDGSVLVSGEVGPAVDILGLAYNSSDGYLYGGNETSLWRINPMDGTSDIITSSGDFRIDGLAYNPNNGLLYAGSRHVTTMWMIDPSNGSTVDVANASVLTMGLTYNTDDGFLYSTRLNDLFRIDPSDWSVTQISAKLGGADITVTGLAYNPIDNYLYGGNTNNLRRISPLDGELVNMGTAGVNRYSGLAFVPEPTTLSLLALGAILLRRRRA